MEDLRLPSVLGVAIIILLIFGSAELLRRYSKLQTEATRKLVHITSGLVTLSFPTLFPSHISVLILAVVFMVFLAICVRFRFLKSIHEVGRTSVGTIVFPISIYLCFIVFQEKNEVIYYFLPLLILIFCDPIAAIVGTKIKSIRFGNTGHSKSLAGSLSFLFASFVLSSSMFIFQDNLETPRAFLYSFILATLTALAEAVSPWGFDNLLVPLIGLGCLQLLCI